MIASTPKDSDRMVTGGDQRLGPRQFGAIEAP